MEKKISPLFICIESSSTNCSVGIIQENVLIDSIEINDGYSHSEKLAVFVDQILKRNQLSFRDFNAVVIGRGPGSYTGLRIGTALAKGISFASKLPLIALDTLKIMSAQVLSSTTIKENALLLPMLDARRMEVYVAVYDQKLENIKPCWAEVLEKSSFEEFKSQHRYIFGPGSDKYFSAYPNDNITFIDHVIPSVKGMLDLVLEKYLANDFENTAYFEPFYLKNFIAGKPKPIF
ncbi:MAG: tRNA (adenosine(37)-N6)-threonylcarbamoyltransferase complex dimerization subunit type 1 TsaB [Flavobacteriales bacterium]|nr:tRNA (adenosine(37)-N6)-threonylcarbamoyltransferase complex dimerization subunit type 1 TsaB [Flavobacteriales bacterium]